MYVVVVFVQYIHFAQKHKIDRPADAADIERCIVAVKHEDVACHLVHPNKKAHRDTVVSGRRIRRLVWRRFFDALKAGRAVGFSRSGMIA